MPDSTSAHSELGTAPKNRPRNDLQHSRDVMPEMRIRIVTTRSPPRAMQYIKMGSHIASLPNFLLSALSTQIRKSAFLLAKPLYIFVFYLPTVGTKTRIRGFR